MRNLRQNAKFMGIADQPVLLDAGLTQDEREQRQKRVEKIHREWPKDRDYFAPPKGKEVGYVPIATRQEWGGSATRPCGH